MELFTLNTHSFAEDNWDEKIAQTIDFIVANQPDVFAMQEVNQPLTAGQQAIYSWQPETIANSHPANYAITVANKLAERGVTYHWAWVPIKIAYKAYDEGVCVFSKTPILEVEDLLLSQATAYDDWRVRRACGVKVNYRGQDVWVYSVHCGWWSDEQEPYTHQWQQLSNAANSKGTPVYLMGDFNAPAHHRDEAYELIVNSEGWFDTYELAQDKCGGNTTPGHIMGWNESTPPQRIDFVFTNRPVQVASSYVVLNGDNGPMVSDHFGLYVKVVD